jgi:hypothetical protein
VVVEVRIQQVDVDVVLGVVLVDGAPVEFIANFELASRSIHLSKVHLHGAGPNSLGAQALREAVQQVMVAFDAAELVLEGGQRVTGASAGPAGTGPRRPKRLHFVRDRR